MTDYRIHSLYSGSGGNSLLVSAGGANILIDAGKSARSLCLSLKAAGSDIEKIDAIFITHEHTDHIGALEVLLRRHRIAVHMTEQSASRLPAAVAASLRELLVLHRTVYEERVGGLTVSSFAASHDSACCVGYKLEFDTPGGSRRSLGYATDTGCVTPQIRDGMTGCEAVVIECNHDVSMLLEGRYPAMLKARILSRRGHLSNDDCAAFASYLADRGTRHFMLAHISRDNNHPSLACAAVRAAVPDERVSIIAADPYEPVLFVG